MSDSSAPWHSAVDAIIPHPSAPRALLLAEHGGSYLPRVSSDDLPAVEADDIEDADLEQICRALRSRFGIATRVLRAASHWSDKEQQQRSMTYVLENCDPAWQPPAHGRWAGRSELDSLARPEQRSALEAYLLEVESGVIPELRPPWGRAGWLDPATAWIEAQLAARGTPLASPVEQVKNWSLSCILRAHTAAGAAYFKVAAALPLFVNEPVVMEALARRFPDHIPMPLSLDPERRWMLLADFGRSLRHAGTLADRQEMLRILGAIHVDCAAAVDQLLELGCYDRRLERLPLMAAALADDEAALAGLTEVESAQFRAALPRFQSMCAALAAYDVPQTLVHGDLHLGNVAVADGHLQFFDWTDACVTHPFFDLISVFYEKDGAVQAQLRDGYLAAWRAVAPPERLTEAWDLAKPLSDLHQAISYQYILVGSEPAARTHFGNAVPYFVRQALRALEPATPVGEGAGQA